MPLRAHVQFTPFDASSGAALTSATVNVFQPGTVTPVVGTLFDKNGNTLTNPLTSDPTTGLVDFYMNVAQEVDLQVAKSGFTTRTYSNVPVLDDAGNDLTALMTTTGDIVYASAANTPARLAVASNLSVLGVAAGLPSYTPAGTANQILVVNNAGNALAWASAAFTSFAPTLTQSVSVTLSTANGRYIQIGKLVIVTIDMVISGAGTAANSMVLGGLPVNTVAPVGSFAMGHGRYFQASGSNRYTVELLYSSATSVFLQSTGQTNLFGIAPAVTAANTDQLAATLMYEAA